MITQTYTINSADFPEPAKDALSMIVFDRRLSEGIFFDIETTGFLASKNALYLIGCCRYSNNSFIITQWLADDPSDEQQQLILEQFIKEIQNAPVLISYNGQSFDLPFLEKKCRALNIAVDFSQWEHWDLYKDFRSLRSLLGLENLKLKTVERFLGISRKDIYSGKALIPIYESYAQNHNKALEELLLLHNFEDIKDMLFILPALTYKQIFSGEWSFAETCKNPHNGSVSITAVFDRLLPARLNDISFSFLFKGHEFPALIQISQQSMCLLLPLVHGEMKYYYDTYKDYYYLPEEDYAIHKSVAAYVDKAYRKKATPRTCYTKKTGEFLPQTEPVFSPAFKEDYNDKISWFEYSDALFTSETARKYIQSFLRFFNLGSF